MKLTLMSLLKENTNRMIFTDNINSNPRTITTRL